MALYEVYIPCNDCTISHSTGMRYTLDDIPTEGVPAHLHILSFEEMRCPKTSRRFSQEEKDQSFLVLVNPSLTPSFDG
jgi:hypothetical protein